MTDPPTRVGQNNSSNSATDDAVAPLRERYARDDIDEAEYRQRLDVLGEPVPDEVGGSEEATHQADTEPER